MPLVWGGRPRRKAQRLQIFCNLAVSCKIRFSRAEGVASVFLMLTHLSTALLLMSVRTRPFGPPSDRSPVKTRRCLARTKKRQFYKIFVRAVLPHTFRLCRLRLRGSRNQGRITLFHIGGFSICRVYPCNDRDTAPPGKFRCFSPESDRPGGFVRQCGGSRSRTDFL